MVFWVIYCFFLASSGDIIVHSATDVCEGTSYSYRIFKYMPAVCYAFLFMLFSLFLVAIGQLVIALCFAAWYSLGTRAQCTVLLSSG